LGTALEGIVAKHGGQVPHYNIFGQRHMRVPFKDKAELATAAVMPEWSRQPKHATRTDLLAARRRADVPNLTYDVDGDGSVGAMDHLICRHFGVKVGESVTPRRREKIVEALENGWLDKHSFGHDRAGASRPFPVKQRNGRIVTVDNSVELGEVYPPHPQSSVQPNFSTQRDLRNHRKWEATTRNTALNTSWHAENPRLVPEPPPAQEYRQEEPRFKNISERREVFRQAAREEAGLDTVGSAVNPERENRSVGLGHRAQPEHATRTELQEARRQQRAQQLLETRVHAEQTWVPRDILDCARDHELHESRRADPDALTLTKLKQSRRIENIEYSMANFSRQEPDGPSFAKQDKPWWMMREGYVHEPACSSKAPPVPSAEASPAPAGPSAGDDGGPRSSRGRSPHTHGSGTDAYPMLANWKREFGPAPLPEHNQPRSYDGVIDGVKQAASYVTDSEPLHRFSSFEAIRGNGQLDAERRQRLVAQEDEDRARAWQSYTKRGRLSENEADARTGGSLRDSLAPPGMTWRGEGSEVVTKKPSKQRASFAAGALSVAPAPNVPALIRSSGLSADIAISPPTSEDLPMTERLDRLVRRPCLAGGGVGDGVSVGAARVGAGSRIREDGDTTSQGVRDLSSALSGQRPSGAPAVAPMGPSHSVLSSATPMHPGPSGGTAAAPATSAMSQHSARIRAPQGMAVRSSGFQWLDQQGVGRPLVDFDQLPSAPASLRPSPHSSRKALGGGHSRSLTGAPTPTPAPAL